MPLDEAEIDLLLKARRSNIAMLEECSHFAIAEVARSVLCHTAEEYEHLALGHLSLTKSSNLLFKLVQLERDACATLGHFGLALYGGTVLGACFVSPTFFDLVDPRSFLDAFFKECYKEFESLINLHTRRHLWLLDM
ncbi:hypothetical protein L7F22_049892 [Adiantum nelumboides]|nr:hypothetical protein [Adiantum nelumboides]